MPGPGKKKAKSKPKPREAVIDWPMAPDALTWNIRADFICDMLGVPDMKTRASLKLVHKDIDSVQRKLDKMYDEFDDSFVRGTIACIWGKLCCDMRLRDQLLKKGILAKMVPLLQDATCQFAVLRAFAVMSHNGGKEARIQIAKEVSRPILDIVDEKFDDPAVVSLCIVTLAHSIATTLDGTHIRLQPDSKLAYPWARITKTMLDVATSPQVTNDAFGHIVHFMTSGATALRDFFLADDRAPQFLVSLLRADNMQLRIEGLIGLMRLAIHGATRTMNKQIDPYKLMGVQWPLHVTDAFAEHGFLRCDIPQKLSCLAEFQDAMMRAAQDIDLVELGRKQYELIYRHELSIANGAFMDENNQRIQTRLPFAMWADSLPHCAKALRALGPTKTFTFGNVKVAAVDMADVLTLKHCLITSQYAEAHRTAVAGIARNPDELYFYYASGIGNEGHEAKLQLSRKGLARVKAGVKIPSTKGTLMNVEDNYVRLGLLANSIDHALFMGVEAAELANDPGHSWQRTVALLEIAYDDSIIWAKNVPPDNRNFNRIYLEHIICRFIWDGPTISSDMHQIQHVWKRLDLGDEICTLAYHTPERSQHRLVVESIREHFPAASKVFGPIVDRFGSSSETSRANIALPAEHEDLYAWFEEDPAMHDTGDGMFLSRWSTDGLELYCCSSCGNASAVLRRCSRCGEARYCDATCQKKHWGDGHKKVCKTGS